MKVISENFTAKNHYSPTLSISDFFTSTELIPKKRLNKWILRPGFVIRRIVILKWIVLGNFLTLGYKTLLLSSLVPIRYEDTIDNIFEVDKSGLPVILLESSSLVDYIAKDPRKVMASINERKIFAPVGAGGIPRWVYEM